MFCIFLCFSYSYVRQTKLASSLVNFWAHNNTVPPLTPAITNQREGYQTQTPPACCILRFFKA